MTKHTPATPLRPQQVAQVVKAGRGWLIVRNSGTLADSDYENVAHEIADALNKRHAYPQLVEDNRELRECLRRLAEVPLFPCDDARNLANLEYHKRSAQNLLSNSTLLRSLGEEV